MKIGVLGLQGNIHSHQQLLRKMDVDSLIVRYPKQLDEVNGLIIPGGESTTMTNLLERINFYHPISEFAKSYPILGTCAGLIMLAKDVNDARVKPLGLLNVSIKRNGYGRQVFSFTDSIAASVNGESKEVKATFIRAPKISKISNATEVLSTYQNEPVAVREGKHIGLTFHPELGGETFFHELMMKA